LGNVTLTQEQAQAADAALAAIRRRQVFTLHGLAGTGKTTVLAHIARETNDAMLVTLTGKAASVLRRKTGLDAQTIHSAFYRLRDKKVVNGRAHMEWDKARKDESLGGSIVLVDECSMVSEAMARDLLATGANIIACGDPGQLPPVSGPQFFAQADAALQTIHRQALDSPIIRQAHRVRAGEAYQPDGDAFQVIRGAEMTKDHITAADVILCWTNRTRQAANAKAREVRGLGLFPQPQAGEPVICLKNVPHLGLFNGAVYTLARPFNEGDRDIHLDLDGTLVNVQGVTFAGLRSGLRPTEEAITSFDFGYAMTVHKAQGSEWPSVLLVDEYRKPEQRKEWLYTGLTRAAERLVVVQ
jgi:exodeoxyribonuclease V